MTPLPPWVSVSRVLGLDLTKAKRAAVVRELVESVEELKDLQWRDSEYSNLSRGESRRLAHLPDEITNLKNKLTNDNP